MLEKNKQSESCLGESRKDLSHLQAVGPYYIVWIVIVNMD